MADKSTISDDHREENDNQPGQSSNRADQYNDYTNRPKGDYYEQQRRENKPMNNTISRKLTQSFSEGIKKSFSIGEQDTSGGIKSIILGLFALIGFIILVYAIFIAVIGQALASVADTVFIAALIGSFTLVATIINHLYIKK
jgi:hypothetical protein